MSLPQQKFREIIFQILYSYEIGKTVSEDILTLLMVELAVSRKNVLLAKEKVDQILKKQKEIDGIIAKTSLSYEFSRIQAVEKNVLRLAVYELLFEKDIPPKVAISEAMRLSKKFSTPESTSFINAILDHIYKTSSGESASTDQIQKASEQLLKSEQAASDG